MFDAQEEDFGSTFGPGTLLAGAEHLDVPARDKPQRIGKAVGKQALLILLVRGDIY